MKARWMAVGTLLVAGAVMTGARDVGPVGPAEKATGEVYFSNGDLWTHVEFNAHEPHRGRPAKGSFYWADDGGMDGRFFLLTLDCVDVVEIEEEGYAQFSGWVTETNIDEWFGLYARVWVHDGGTPGREGDRLHGEFLMPGEECPPYEDPMTWLFDIEEGNLTVHLR